MTVCIVVPHFNHADSLVHFLPRLTALNLPIVLVDDGSDQEQFSKIQNACEQQPSVTILQHGQNQGKGAAMMTGADHAINQGFTHMLQVDADGQHDMHDVPKFLAASKKQPGAIISGAPQFDNSAPKARVYGRKVTDFFVALETWRLDIKDSLCGYRIYPLTAFQAVCQRYRIGRRMDVDTDLIVKSVWHGVPYAFIDTRVVYQPGNTSHFHYLRDNLRLIALHTRLLLGMLVRAPWWLLQGLMNRLRGTRAELG